MRVVFFSEARRIYLAFTETFLTTFCTQKRMVPRETQIRTIKFLFASSSTLCILLSFPHYKCFIKFFWLLYSFTTRAKKKRRELYLFVARSLRGKRREGSRESCTSKVHVIRVERLTRECKTKIQIESHHGTCNALLSSSIGAFYVRFDPPTTAPSGALEKCAKNDDDDDAK